MDFGDGACAANLMDSRVTIFPAEGTTPLASDNDGGIGYCSRAQVDVAAPGAHFVCVEGNSSDDRFPYSLDLRFQDPGCGGGFVDGAEQCDDGNTAGGDGCDASCAAESCQAPQPAANGVQTGDTTGGGALLAGSCSSSGGHTAREDVWQYVPAATGTVRIVATPNGDADIVLYVRTGCADTATELDCADIGYGGDAESADIAATEGMPIFIVVDGYSSGEGPYTLSITPP
ncbi:MAG: hypothetical protein IT382_23525 [Deltaproteobacteria bacterium]|nr:hypothetical protein [Deltaproteobacteria bacterium]